MTQPVPDLAPWADCRLTADPYVRIEYREPGYVRYQNGDGRRWIVRGVCDRRGDCMIGAVIDGYGEIEDYADIEEARQILGDERIDAAFDVPATPEFEGCCADPITGTLAFEELPPVA